jgi:hypothetical protein
MANVIKIKRSLSVATPTSLVEGELAYSENSKNLFIGESGGNIKNIGGDQALKANVADVYTQTQVDNAVGLKADQSTTYTKIATDALLDAKANQSTTYTKTEVNTAVGAKADQATTNTKIEDAAALALKSDTGHDHNTAYYTKAQVDSTYAKLASPTFTGIANVATASAGTNTTQIASTAFVTTAVAAVSGGGGAGTDSPAFTGTPTAPTAAAGTNTTQLATTQFVTSATTVAINALVNSAPAALDTLAELSAALGADENFATTITNAIGLKMDADAVLDGGTF